MMAFPVGAFSFPMISGHTSQALLRTYRGLALWIFSVKEICEITCKKDCLAFPEAGQMTLRCEFPCSMPHPHPPAILSLKVKEHRGMGETHLAKFPTFLCLVHIVHTLHRLTVSMGLHTCMKHSLSYKTHSAKICMFFSH
jgi:hypothetical protein